MAKYDLETIRHSAAHVMADAVKRIFPEAKIAIGPAIEDGFYYDFDYPDGFTPDDLERIENKMHDIVRSKQKFERRDVSKKEARKLFSTEKYKLEILDELEGDTVTIYKHGDFVDLCKGPHVGNTSDIKAFKLLKVAGAYWRGIEGNQMLQRIYGTAFLSEAELSEYLKRLEEASLRDHRRLGRELDLYSTMEDYGPGLILWHPMGSRVRHVIEDFWRQEHFKNGYEIVFTPHIARLDLWKASGHWEFYREYMYSPMDVDGIEYELKPMNCPFHVQIYKSRQRSYREFPIRWAELGTVYRYERSGVLQGLLRVRGFTQDDAHHFCRKDQLADEIKFIFDFSLFILRSFGFKDFDIFLSTKPEKRVGDDEEWELATKALEGVLKDSGLKWAVDQGEGVFYGPKIDIKIKDCLGRAWQCTTIQVDFNLPHRYRIEYIGEDSQRKRPIMIHRALMGSLERFFGVLIEHYAGAFPLWLAPVQASILTITERQGDFAQKLCERLDKSGLRVELDNRNEKLGFKIREATVKKIPYMLVVGDKEVSLNKVAVRSRLKGDLGQMEIDGFITLMKDEIKTKLTKH